MSANLVASLAESWMERAGRARTDLALAASAPGLFRPEYVAERREDFARSMAWAGYWLGQID